MKRYNKQVHQVGNKKSYITKMHGQQHIKTVSLFLLTNILKDKDQYHFLFVSSRHCNCKAIPIQAQTGPEGSRRFRLEMSRQSAHEDGGNVISPKHRPPLPHRKYFWYPFLLEAESAPGPQCGRKEYVNEQLQRQERESSPRPSGLFTHKNIILYILRTVLCCWSWKGGQQLQKLVFLHIVAMDGKLIANRVLHPQISTGNRRNFSEHGQKSSTEETLTEHKNETRRKERTPRKRDFEVEICSLNLQAPCVLYIRTGVSLLSREHFLYI